MSNTKQYQAVNDAIQRAASEITDLWWTRPDKNGHVKCQIVKDIISRHLIGIPRGPATLPTDRQEWLEEVEL